MRLKRITPDLWQWTQDLMQTLDLPVEFYRSSGIGSLCGSDMLYVSENPAFPLDRSPELSNE